MDYRHRLGALGEARVKQIFLDQGFTLLAQRARLFGAAEVDLFLQRGSLLCLVEVKTQHLLTAMPEILSQKQLQRLQKLLGRAQAHWRAYEVELVIAWVNPANFHVEFLRNPC